MSHEATKNTSVDDTGLSAHIPKEEEDALPISEPISPGPQGPRDIMTEPPKQTMHPKDTANESVAPIKNSEVGIPMQQAKTSGPVFGGTGDPSGGSGTWAAELCDSGSNSPCCQPFDLCIMGCCCPSVLFANNIHMLQKNEIVEPCSCVGCCKEECWIRYAIGSFAAFLLNPYGSAYFGGCCAALGLNYGWLSKYTARNVRMELRHKYGIKDQYLQRDEQGLCRESCQCCVDPATGCCGDSPEDSRAVCTHFWCDCCGSVQEYKTITAQINKRTV